MFLRFYRCRKHSNRRTWPCLDSRAFQQREEQGERQVESPQGDSKGQVLFCWVLKEDVGVRRLLQPRCRCGKAHDGAVRSSKRLPMYSLSLVPLPDALDTQDIRPRMQRREDVPETLAEWVLPLFELLIFRIILFLQLVGSTSPRFLRQRPKYSHTYAFDDRSFSYSRYRRISNARWDTVYSSPSSPKSETQIGQWVRNATEQEENQDFNGTCCWSSRLNKRSSLWSLRRTRCSLPLSFLVDSWLVLAILSCILALSTCLSLWTLQDGLDRGFSIVKLASEGMKYVLEVQNNWSCNFAGPRWPTALLLL